MTTALACLLAFPLAGAVLQAALRPRLSRAASGGLAALAMGVLAATGLFTVYGMA